MKAIFHGIAMLAATIVLGVAGCSDQTGKAEGKGAEKDAPAAATVLRIGVQPYPLYAPLWAAKEQGYLDEELARVGATHTWTSFKAGPIVNEAVASGNIDIGVMADMPAILARSSGQDVVIFSHLAHGERALALIVKRDSPIQNVGDIKGRKIAFVKGSYAQHLLALLLKNNGLSFNDITSVNIGAGDMPAALEQGDIDGALVWEQYISQLVVPGRARVVADGTGIKKGNNVAYVVSSFGKAHPEVLVAFVKAVQRGADYINADKKAAAARLAKAFSVSPEVLEAVFDNFTYYARFEADDIAELEKVKNYILAEKIIPRDVPIGELLTTEYIQRAGLAAP